MFLAASIIIAYFIFKNPAVSKLILDLGELSYLSVFIAGIFFSFGFTTPFAIGFFALTNVDNLLIAALLGGLGSAAGNLLFYKLIKNSFADEIKKFENTKDFKRIEQAFSKNLDHRLKVYILYIFVGIIMVSPLPDEIALTIMTSLPKIKLSLIAILSFILHSFGILIFLLV